MVKKETKVTLKSLFNQFMERSLQSLISVVAEQAEHLMGLIKNIPAIKRKIKSMLTAVVFFAAGLVVFGLGISIYLAETFSGLSNGASHILVGLIFIIIAAIYLKAE